MTRKKNRRSDTCSRRIVLQLKNCITSRPLGKRCASYLVKFHQQRGLPATGDKTKNTRMLHTVLENVVRCTFLIVFSFYGCSFFRAGNGSKVCVCIACAASLPYMRQVRKSFLELAETIQRFRLCRMLFMSRYTRVHFSKVVWRSWGLTHRQICHRVHAWTRVHKKPQFPSSHLSCW